MLRKLSWIFCLAFLSVSSQAAELTATAREEISFLLTHLEQSDCEFNRNGNWHAAPEASAHLRRKLAYLERNELIASTEDFIAWGASSSSTSKQAYLVRCPNVPSVESATWLKKALEKYRQTKPR